MQRPAPRVLAEAASEPATVGLAQAKSKADVILHFGPHQPFPTAFVTRRCSGPPPGPSPGNLTNTTSTISLTLRLYRLKILSHQPYPIVNHFPGPSPGLAWAKPLLFLTNRSTIQPGLLLPFGKFLALVGLGQALATSYPGPSPVLP